MIQPVNNQVLIVEAKQKDRTAGGLYLPESAQKSRAELRVGVIVNVGENISTHLEIGQTVIYNAGYAARGSFNQKDFIIVEDKHVVAVVTNDGEDTNAE